MAGVYILENIINHKCYVGQTVNSFETRFYQHTKDKRTIICRAINKYGWENFKKYIYHIPENLLDYFEIEMIKKVNSLVPNGYNLEAGGRGGRPCAKTRRKQSDAHKGIHLSEEHKRNIGLSQVGRVSPMKGKVHSEESKKKTSDAMKGRKKPPRTEEHKRNLSIALKNPSKETREKISKAGKGRIPWNKGKKFNFTSTETRLKLSIAAKKDWKKRKGLI